MQLLNQIDFAVKDLEFYTIQKKRKKEKMSSRYFIIYNLNNFHIDEKRWDRMMNFNDLLTLSYCKEEEAALSIVLGDNFLH